MSCWKSWRTYWWVCWASHKCQITRGRVMLIDCYGGNQGMLHRTMWWGCNSSCCITYLVTMAARDVLYGSAMDDHSWPADDITPYCVWQQWMISTTGGPHAQLSPTSAFLKLTSSPGWWENARKAVVTRHQLSVVTITIDLNYHFLLSAASKINIFTYKCIVHIIVTLQVFADIYGVYQIYTAQRHRQFIRYPVVRQ